MANRARRHASRFASATAGTDWFFNDTAPTEIYTLSLRDALPIWGNRVEVKSTVQENGRDTGWYQIDYNGKTAYVAAMYVSKTAPTAQPVQKDTAFTGYVTSAGELNVREQPRATSRRLGGLPTGSKVEVKAAVQENGRDTGWYQIDYNGKTAYVAAMYISKTAPS